MTIRRGRIAAFFCAALFYATTATAQTHVPCPVLNATSTAEYQLTGPYVGNWRYTIQVAWDVGRHDPSHVDVIIGLTQCQCRCDARLFKFPSPAGTSTGVNASGACTVPYAGLYACKGDPSIKDATTGSAVKFQPDESACSTDESGSGTFVFYSPLPPGAPEHYLDAVAVKHGLDTCWGEIVGVLPICDCSVPSEDLSWGRMKSIYR
jgi:hypothetical protein